MDPFATPRGLLGWLAGHLMAAANQPMQAELLPLVAVHPGQRILEVGYGPGRMLALLLAQPGVTVAGVDPSPTMRNLARRHNRAAGDRLDLRLGTAAATGFPACHFDRVVSVNNVQLWPDRAAGLAELHRVTAPAGRLVLAVHSRHSKARYARRLGMNDQQLAELGAALAARYDRVTSHRLAYTDVFVAVRRR